MVNLLANKRRRYTWNPSLSRAYNARERPLEIETGDWV